MVDAAVIKKTQDSLGKVIKKPPLTEKLLSKPPFRYLHDIISEVIKNTGFLEGLYGENEKSSGNIKEKDQKIAFLQKTIDAVGLAAGSPLSTRPSKIIAGQEPDKTNEFLQLLGRCAAKGANADVVARVKKGEKPVKKSESKERTKERSKERTDGKRSGKSSKERDGSKGRREESKERLGSKERSKERVSGSSKERVSKERPERRRERGREERKPKGEAKSSVQDDEEKKRKEKEERKEEERREKEEKRRRREAEEEERRMEQEAGAGAAEAGQEGSEGGEDKPMTNGFHEDDIPARIPRPSSAKGVRRRPEPHLTDAEREKVDPYERAKSGRRRAREVASARRRRGAREVASASRHRQPHAIPGEESKPTYAEAVVGATTAEPAVPIVAGKRRERPTSARPAPPRIKKRDDGSNEELAVREVSGRPPAGIIVDNQPAEDEDEMFVKEETEETAAVKQPVIMGSNGQHGGLVQKIIDSQKQYNQNDKQEQDRAPVMNQAARQKERALVRKEIDQLRAGIQTLASSAAPLGKVLDYLQEDLDSMSKELDTWRSENKYHETAINAEESHMEKTLEPLRDQLDDTEHQIVDMINKINTMKCNIHNNDKKIGQMLSTMSFSAS